MSGDVQPRKRKDKKKKKDDLSVEEPRGTAAALGEGDVFIHSQQDHVTGGHWCAKIIFFSLLAVLITLIGLIILENRGLTELEANAVESRYSGVLEGWLEDAPDDDHHDEHTLDLKHHDVDEEDEDHHNVEELDHDEEDHEDEEDQDDEESHEVDTEADEDELDQEESHEENNEADEEDEEKYIASNEVDSNEEQDDNESEENLQDDDDNEDVEEKVTYKRYLYNEDKDEDDANNDDQDYDKNNENGDHNDDDDENDDGEDDLNEDDDDQNDDDDDQNDNEDNEDQNDNLVEQNYNAEQNEDQSIEHNNYQYGDDDDDDDDSKEIEQEGEDFSNEILYDNDKDGDDDNESNEQRNNDQNNEDEEEQGVDSQEDDEEEIEKIEKEIIEDDADSNEIVAHRNYDEDDEQASKEDREADDDENDLQDQEDDDEPPLERITAPPAGKPFVEIEEEVIEKPVNTLAEEEEYEKRQEQLRREEEEAAQGSHTWLKLAVGGALLVATHAVLRRVTAPRDIPEPEEETREETPIVDRRMTITHEQFPPRVQESPLTQIAREIEEEVFKKPAPVTRSAPVVKQDSEEDVIVKKGPVLEKAPVVDTKDEEKELYSDEEEEEEVEDDEEEEDIEVPLKEVQKKAVPMAEQKPTEDSEPEDVEIIDDEQMEEELEDEEIEDEEEISDVDDTELLTRLEAKYGRLPEPERFGRQPDSFGPKHKDGGNSIEDEWPGEPSDAYWRTELNVAEEELRQGEWSACERRVSAAALAGSARARWLAARAADLAAEAKRDNSLLSRAIAAYLHLLKMNERLSDKKLLEVAQRAIDRIQFRGTYLNAEPIYRLLIRRFPDDVNYRNNLTVSFLMANRADLADEVLKETLRLWPNDRVALAHHGFVLKTKYNNLEEAVNALYKALEGDTGPANEPRFYYHLGDALLLLGRPEEAHEVHKRGAALGHFLSPAQRSLYNVPRLRSRPWWPIEETPYLNLARELESSWKEILKEGEAAKALYEKEKEGLKERGDWTQLDLFVRGAEIPGRCARAPVTCAIVRREAAAARCRRGQVKFSAMAAGTHVRAHVGPTNCRLRMHLGLSNPKNTYLRVDKETRQWQIGKTFLFDDSFEHEVWHNGTGARLVLIVDVWHPDLTAEEKRTLPAI